MLYNRRDIHRLLIGKRLIIGVVNNWRYNFNQLCGTKTIVFFSVNFGTADKSPFYLKYKSHYLFVEILNFKFHFEIINKKQTCSVIDHIIKTAAKMTIDEVLETE